MPEGTNSLLSFTTFKNMVSAPLVIYSDLKTCIEEEEVVKRGKVMSRRHHVPISVAALTVCRDRPEFGSKSFIYTRRNCIDVLLDYLDHKVDCLREIYENVCIYQIFSSPCQILNASVMESQIMFLTNVVFFYSFVFNIYVTLF